MADTAKPGFLTLVKSYPRQFWVVNTMEIFERLSWYGWFTVMALYVTGSIETGGLGFSTETRGALQAIVPFFLYLLPVLTGAMADRYGYKKSFITAFLIMMLAYYLLGQFTGLPSFFMAFLFVAVGAGIFKPVVTGTVAKVTNGSNSALGFGIFYMMVNIGGFLGPIVAGYVRGIGWEYVFMVCAGWAVVNLTIVLTLYEEPKREEGQRKGSLKDVMDGMVEVLGNARFFITVFVVLFILMFANLRVGPFVDFTWTHAGIFVPIWILGNLFLDRFLPADDGRKGGNPLMKRMHCSNWRFAVFLLIMSGFWTSFNQIFYTMPEYIRDFGETRPLISSAEGLFGASDPTDPDKGVASKVATVNPKEKKKILRRLSPTYRVLKAGAEGRAEVLAWGAVFALPVDEVSAEGGKDKATQAVAGVYKSLGLKVPGDAYVIAEMAQDLARIPAPVWETERVQGLMKALAHLPLVASLDQAGRDGLRKALVATSYSLLDTKLRILPQALAEKAAEAKNVDELTSAVVVSSRQFNPEFIVNINAFSIIIFQVFVSFFMARFHQFTTMIVGMVVAAVGIGLPMLAGTEGIVGMGGMIWMVAGGLFIFSFGEMMASPTSQEYVGRIAPSDKKALYMGYYFVAVALGNLFGGILSGELYGRLARDMQRPDLMWMLFGGLMMLTALVFVIYNRYALPRGEETDLS